MRTFRLHTPETAPAASRDAMAAASKKFGFLPNLIREMAEAPATLRGYLALGQALQEASLSPVERELVLVSISLANGCKYCVAAHSAGLRAAGFPAAQLTALREGRALDDARLEALRNFATAVTETRGWPDVDTMRATRKAGYQNRHLLEVLLAVGMKTISNYVNHLADTPLDEELRAFERTSTPVA